MNGRSSTRAPKGAAGACRNRRAQDARPAGWLRPFTRACNAVDGAIRLISRISRTVARVEPCAHRHPVRTARQYQDVFAVARLARKRLDRAARQVAEMKACSLREPERGAAYATTFADSVTRSCAVAAEMLQETEAQLAALQAELRDGLESGELVPEPQPVPHRRPRIVLRPRPVPIRAFLALRESRVADRISPLLRRRRRIPAPASVRVPRRCLRGRAPPLPSTCAL